MNRFTRIVYSLAIVAYGFSVPLLSYRQDTTFAAKAIAVLLGILFFVGILILHRKIVWTREFSLLAAWLFLVVLLSLFAIDFNVFAKSFVTVTTIIVCSFFVVQILYWIDKPRLPLLCIFGATLIMSVLAVRSPFRYSVAGRAVGTFSNANVFGMACLVSLMFAFDRILDQKNKLIKAFFLVSLPFLFYMLFQSGSRKAIISIFLYIAVLAVFYLKANFKQRFWTAIFVTFFFIATALVAVNYLEKSKWYDRMEAFGSVLKTTNVNRSEDGSLKGRFLFYRVGWNLFTMYPATGVGLGNFQVALPRYISGGSLVAASGTGTYAHSNYIEILADTGIIGFILYFSVYAALFLRLIRARKSVTDPRRKSLFVMLLSFLIIIAASDVATVSFDEKFSWLVFVSIIAGTNTISKGLDNRGLNRKA
jgi:O-antigen ligase